MKNILLVVIVCNVFLVNAQNQIALKTESVTNGSPISLTTESNALYVQGQNDARKNYIATTPVAITLFTTFIGTGGLGFIAAATCSDTELSNKSLNIPNKELMNNPEYKKGYIERSKRIRNNKVWICWGIGTLMNVALLTAIVQSK